jgi:hypothetical protein
MFNIFWIPTTNAHLFFADLIVYLVPTRQRFKSKYLSF